MTRPVSVFSAAKRLGEKSGWTLSHLQMQKLLYIAHMYYLGMRGERLIDSYFEAWDYGPVCPELYHDLKIYGADYVPEDALSFYPSISEGHPGRLYLDATVDQLSQSRLIAITHWKKGAWARNYRPGTRNIRIPDKDIKKEYQNRIAV